MSPGNPDTSPFWLSSACRVRGRHPSPQNAGVAPRGCPLGSAVPHAKHSHRPGSRQAGFAKNDRVLLEFATLVLMGLGFEAVVQLIPKPAPVLNEGCSDGNAERDLESSSPGVRRRPMAACGCCLLLFLAGFRNKHPSRYVFYALPFPPFPAARAIPAGGCCWAPVWLCPPPRDAFLGCFWEGLACGQAGGPPPPPQSWLVLGEKKERLGAGVCAGPCGSRTPHVVWGQGLGETPGEPRDLASFGSSLSLAK